MIYVFKMLGGADYIGRLAAEPNFEQGFVELEDPMEIEKSAEGMRLRDVLLFGRGDSLKFKLQHIITYYSPSEKMVNYYNRATVFSKNYTKPAIEEQIQTAMDELDDIMREDTDPTSMFTQLGDSTTVH